jgi:hypothetical protein
MVSAMTDIVERLRLSVTKGHEPTDEDAIEAAAEIERLRNMLNKIAKNPDTPELIRQYAAGMLEPKP